MDSIAKPPDQLGVSISTDWNHGSAVAGENTLPVAALISSPNLVEMREIDDEAAVDTEEVVGCPYDLFGFCDRADVTNRFASVEKNFGFVRFGGDVDHRPCVDSLPKSVGDVSEKSQNDSFILRSWCGPARLLFSGV